MPHFNYIARNAEGAEERGLVEAAGKKQAVSLLRARRLTPVHVDDGAGSVMAGAVRNALPAIPSISFRRSAGPTRRQLLPFLRALSELVGSGMQVGESIRLLSIRLTDPKMKALAARIWEELSEGSSLSEAMAAQPDIFNPSIVHLIEAGEATGNLKEVLTRLVTHLETMKELRTRTVSSLAYPCFILVMAGAVVLFSLFFLFPRLTALLDAMGGNLPVTARVFIATAEFLLQYGLFIVIGLLLVLIGFWRWRETEDGRYRIDAFLLRLPVFSRYILDNAILQLSQNLAILLENGINMPEALRMTQNIISNRVVAAKLSDVRMRVVEGTSLSHSLRSAGVLPDLVADMLAVGENTGNVVPSLRELARIYRGKLDQNTRVLTGVVSVGTLLVAFGFVALIAYVILVSVFQVGGGFSM